MPLKELNLQFFLELFDLVTEARLGHTQVPAGGRKAGATDNSDKVAYLPHVHDTGPPCLLCVRSPTAWEAVWRRGYQLKLSATCHASDIAAQNSCCDAHEK